MHNEHDGYSFTKGQLLARRRAERKLLLARVLTALFMAAMNAGMFLYHNPSDLRTAVVFGSVGALIGYVGYVIEPMRIMIYGWGLCAAGVALYWLLGWLLF